MQAFRPTATGFLAGILSLFWIAAALAADPAPQVSLNIKPQPLDAALNTFAQQSGLQIVYLSGVGKGLTSPRISGDYTATAALDLLLADTTLVYRFLNERTVEISVKAQKEVKKQSSTGTSGSTGAGLRLAGNEPASPDAAALPAGDEDTGANSSAVPEILVKGSRVLNTDIRRTQDDAQPYVVFDRETIERSGAINIEDFLRGRLTSAAGFATNAQYADQTGSYSRIDLRGLGDAETLILIDGRRVGGRNRSGSPQQPDLNAISLTSIERIEVLPATASAIYGGGATGGVINIILRRDYAGVETKVTYGNTFSSDVAQRRADISAGLAFEEGRSQLLLSGSYSDSNRLLEQDRGLRWRGRQHILANNPGAILGGVNPPPGGATNIRSSDGSNLVLDTGIVLDSPIVSVPVGYSGIASDGGVEFARRGGQYNLDLSPFFQADGLQRSLVDAPQVYSGSATFKRQFSSRFDAYLEVGASRFRSTSVGDGSPGTVTLSATDPGNPFTRAIAVTTIIDIEVPTRNTSLDRRAVVGAVFGLPGGWKLNADYAWTWNRSSSSRPGMINTTAFAAAVRSGALDIFRDLSAYPVDYSTYMRAPVVQSPVESSLSTASLRVGGPVVRLPGGNLVVTGLLEQQRRNMDTYRTIDPQNNGSLRETIAPERSEAVDSLYLEMMVPVIGPGNGIRGAELLEVQLAGRVDRYDIDTANRITIDAGVPSEPVSRIRKRFSSSDPTVALRYRPIEGLMMRASWATGYLPPSLAILAPSLRPPSQLSAIVARILNYTDPLRGDEFLAQTVQVQRYTSEGNPDLRPENSESMSAGLVLTPRFAPALRVGLDWTHIERTDNAMFLGLSSDRALQNAFILNVPGSVVRAPVAAGDPYGVGQIIEVHETRANVARVEVEAYDLAVDYAWSTPEFGQFRFSGRTTYAPVNKLQVIQRAAVVETAGVGGKLEWRSSATLSWDRGNWTAAWTSRYYDSYYLNSAHLPDASQGSARVPSQHYHDMYVGYRFDALRNFLSGAEIDVGINNVFDTVPPVDVSTLSRYYSPLGDARLANYYVSLRKSL